MKLIVDITQEDINNGKRGKPNQCPVAYGLRRLSPEAFRVDVNGRTDAQSIGYYWTAHVQSLNGGFHFSIPKDIVQRIKDFDKTGVMTPFTFTVDI